MIKKFLLLSFIILSLSSKAQCWKKVASKFENSIALHHDSSVWVWGGYFQRNKTVPRCLDSTYSWIHVTAGNQFCLAIKSDGTLWAYGYNDYGQLGLGNNTNQWNLTQVGTDSDWKKVEAGFGFVYAIKNNGTLWAWGQNNYGQLGNGTNFTHIYTPTQKGTDTDWVDVSSGKYQSLIKKINGTIWFVGACFSSQSSSIHQVGSATNWKEIGSGSYTDFAIKTDGSLWTWNNSNGTYTAPTRIGIQNDWDKLSNSLSSSTEDQALFIKQNSSLWGIGSNKFAQLANDSLVNYSNPIQIGNEYDWLDVVAGDLYSFALKQDYSFWAWGRNNHGQFGNGENENTLKSIGDSRWLEVATPLGSYNGHTLAIRDDGTLWAWGQNNDGQLGDNQPYNHKTLPVKIGNDTTWKSVSNGFHFSLAIKNDGTLWAWGRDGYGQMGDGGNWTGSDVPIQVGTENNWLKIAAGSEHAIALKNDSTLWVWGRNNVGQLGQTIAGEYQTTPIQLGTTHDWIEISSGSQHSLAIKSNGTLWAWGYNTSGQLGRGGSSLIPIQVGSSSWLKVDAGGLHTIAIKSDSTLWTWGYNIYAQLGNGGTNSSSLPVQIDANHVWINIAGGYEHSLGIKNDHTLWAWGRNAHGQIADTATYDDFLSKTYLPTQVSGSTNWAKIDGGPVNSIFINDQGELFTSGDGYVTEYQMHFPQLGYLQILPKRVETCFYCLTTFDTLSTQICLGDSVLFRNNYYLSSGVYTDSLTNINGCDSLLILNLNVLNPSYSVDAQSACESFTWVDGNTYTNSTNIPTFNFVAANGCDSIVNLNLTILNPSSGVDIQTVCESFTWIDGNTYTNSTTIPTSILVAANGCDSIVNLNLTILNPSSGVDVQTACESFTWIDGNTYTNSTNSPIFTLVASNGCDSIVNLNLDLIQLNDSINLNGNSLQALQNNASYQWLDCNNGNQEILGETMQSFSPLIDGSYAVEITSSNCTVTSSCFDFETSGVGNLDKEYFRIYPNPTKGEFTIDSKLNGNITLYSSLGAKIKRFPIQIGKNEIQLQNLAKGTYLLLLESEQKYFKIFIE